MGFLVSISANIGLFLVGCAKAENLKMGFLITLSLFHIHAHTHTEARACAHSHTKVDTLLMLTESTDQLFSAQRCLYSWQQ